MLHFSKPALEEALRRLKGPQRVAFAASAAERLFAVFAYPAARMGSRRGETLSRWLDVAWRSVTDKANQSELVDCIEQIRSLSDEVAQGLEDTGDLDELPDEPLYAVMNALQVGLSHDVGQAATAAEWVYNYLDNKIAQRPDMPEIITGRDVTEYNSRIERDPLVQAELKRQGADIAALSELGDQDLASLARLLRDRSRIAASELVEAR